jgi:hypothetical protein
MTDDRLPLADLRAKAGDGDFLRSVAEAVLQMLMEADAARCDSGRGGGAAMPTPPFLLTTAQMRRLSPHFPLSHGIARVDDRRVLSGIIYVIRNGLQWRDAPTAYGPHKTLYNRFVR